MSTNVELKSIPTWEQATVTLLAIDFAIVNQTQEKAEKY